MAHVLLRDDLFFLLSKQLHFVVQDLSQDHFFDKLYKDNNSADTHEIHETCTPEHLLLSLYSDNKQNVIFEDELEA